MLPVSVAGVEKQKWSSGWQTCAVGDATPYGAGKKPLAQHK